MTQTSSNAPDLFTRPPRGVLPISKGGDLVVDFLQAIDGVFTDYAPGVAVRLVLDTDPLGISATAVISGYHAVCKVESESADGVLPNTTWRCVVSYPTVPTTEIVAYNGTTARADS
jgi:hypothetical protein